MRNVIEYPVTTEEAVTTLRQIAEELLKAEPLMCGDMRPFILTTAAEKIDKDTANIARLRDAIVGQLICEDSDRPGPEFQCFLCDGPIASTRAIEHTDDCPFHSKHF